ncbi:hypothetical protein E2C01_055452 [Portunus trituberculatus]|uniref:Uncharacterized protein n=1 Tax=Portunus trituberculatus TaxID=210409 RepID=A0A5B7GMH2_PORTR|nr:hypothetical protein [Portunus trituberculatus]
MKSPYVDVLEEQKSQCQSAYCDYSKLAPDITKVMSTCDEGRQVRIMLQPIFQDKQEGDYPQNMLADKNSRDSRKQKMWKTISLINL